jgi:hypothetical protein
MLWKGALPDLVKVSYSKVHVAHEVITIAIH